MIESLWWRLDNIVYGVGREFMEYTERIERYTEQSSNEEQKEEDKKAHYFMISTLYILASVLAYNRIMILEGIYAQLEELMPKPAKTISGNWLKEELRKFDQQLDKMGVSFFQYERIAFTEYLIKRAQDDNRLFISTYLEFVRDITKYFSSDEKLLSPAIDFVAKVHKYQLRKLMGNNMSKHHLDEVMTSLCLTPLLKVSHADPTSRVNINCIF